MHVWHVKLDEVMIVFEKFMENYKVTTIFTTKGLQINMVINVICPISTT